MSRRSVCDKPAISKTQQPQDWVDRAKEDPHSYKKGKFVSLYAEVKQHLIIDDEDGFKKTIGGIKSCKPILQEWEDLHPDNDISEMARRLECSGIPIGYIPTCRYKEQPIRLDTRVGLKSGGGKPSLIKYTGSTTGMRPTMLHMNYVQDLTSFEAYIMTQAPKENEMEIFLTIIMEQSVEVVIAPVNDLDMVRQRVFAYFEMSECKSKTYGSLELTCAWIITSNREFDLRKLTINDAKNHKTKSIFHIHYKQWDDNATNDDAVHVVQIKKALDRARETGQIMPDSVTLVHCSAGIGRSGTLVVSFLAFDWIKYRNWPLNIFAIAKRVRKQRLNSIQNCRQYALVFCAVGEYIKHAEKNAFSDTTCCCCY